MRASHGGISVYYDSEEIEIESDIPLIYDDGENEIRLVPGRHCIRKVMSKPKFIKIQATVL